MKTMVSIFLFLASFRLFASGVICEGWYQQSGESLNKINLAVISSNNDNVVYSGNSNGYSYHVDWNKSLTTFYIRIKKGEKYILGTTARVPTDDHPENFTDLHIPGGPRLSVNCEMK